MARRSNNSIPVEKNNDVEVKEEQKEVVQVVEENLNNNSENTVNDNTEENAESVENEIKDAEVIVDDNTVDNTELVQNEKEENQKVVEEKKEIEFLKVVESFRDKYNDKIYNVNDILKIVEYPIETIKYKETYKEHQINKTRATELLKTNFVAVIK